MKLTLLAKKGGVGTPTTIVIQADGHVSRIWYGAYSASIAPEIERFFGTTLPARVGGL
jgi:hypothetical protein